MGLLESTNLVLAMHPGSGLEFALFLPKTRVIELLESYAGLGEKA